MHAGITLDINFVAQGGIGPGTKLEDGKGTASSGAGTFLLSAKLSFGSVGH